MAILKAINVSDLTCRHNPVQLMFAIDEHMIFHIHLRFHFRDKILASLIEARGETTFPRKGKTE